MSISERVIGSSSWPPEVPPFRPGRPAEPPTPSPTPIVPTWYEPDPAWAERDLAERLLEQRIVMVGGRLDDALANRVAAQLLLLSDRSTRPIRLHLACPDGELDAALALADAAELVSAPIHATVRGTLGGPPVAVLCVAQERIAHPHAVLVLSLPPSKSEGTAGELAVRAEQHERQVARLRDLVSAASGRSTEEVADDLRRGRVLSAEEARSYGLLQRLL